MSSSRLSSVLLAGTAVTLALNVPAAAAEQEAARAPERAIPELIVEGQALNDFRVQQSGIGKLTEVLRDTPQSVSTISREVIEQRNITNLNDAFRNVPGITLGASEFNWQGNNPNIRGFNSRSDMFMDGMRDFGNYFRDPFNYEQIEVLQGPASMVFGRGSTGGVVNSVVKQAHLGQSIFGSVNVGTDTTKRVLADVNEELPELGDGTAIRLNAMGHDGAVAGRDGGQQQRWGVGLSLALGLGSPTRLYANYVHQSNNDVPDYGLPWFGTSVAQVPRDNFYGFNSDYQKAEADIVTLKLDHDFSEDLKLHTQARYGDYARQNRITEPQIPATFAAGTPPANVTVVRNVFAGFATETFLQAQADLNARVMTGGIEHKIVTGLEVGRERSAPWFGFAQGVPGTNLLAPEKNAFFVSTGTPPSVIADTTGTSFGVYALDTMKISEMFQLVGGLRWDSFRVNYGASRHTSATGAFVSAERVVHVDKEFSIKAGVIFKPVEEGTIYFSYGTSFNPSAESLTFITAARGGFGIGNAFLDPEKNKNFELGTKWDLLDGKLAANAALFRITKDNARVPNPQTPGFNTLGGTHRAQGFDVNFTGYVTRDWQIIAGYVFLDGEVTKVPAIPGVPAVGAPLPYAPRHSLSFWTSYLITHNIQIGAGGQRVGKRFAQNTAPIRAVPGFWTFDAMVQYNFSDHLMLKVNLTNLTDKYFYDALHQQHVVPGAGRTAMFAVNLRY